MHFAIVKARPLAEPGDNFLETVNEFVRQHERANLDSNPRNGGYDHKSSFNKGAWRS